MLKLCHCCLDSVEKFPLKSQSLLEVRARITAALRQRRTEEIKVQKPHRWAKINFCGAAATLTKTRQECVQFFEDPAEHRCELLFKGAKLCPQLDERAHAQTQTCAHVRMWVGALCNAPISLVLAADNQKRLLHRKRCIKQSRQRRRTEDS